ncbi:MAG: flavoprotein [Candidatus Omnitrophota bacterium]
MKKNILLGITASIAAYKACELIGRFRKKGYKVKCVMTAQAKYFITPLTLETLSGEKAECDMFSLPEKRDPLHISLADKADVILVAPATADIIAKTAAGICDDLLTCSICATRTPVVFAPAMNERMFKNVILQEKIKYLKKNGYYFIEPIKGRLACGDEGIGHLAEIDTIVEEIENILKA